MSTNLIQFMLDRFDVAIKVFRNGGYRAICIVDTETVSMGVDNDSAHEAIFQACSSFIDKQGDPQVEKWQKELRSIWKAARAAQCPAKHK